jgi:branched-chain amino acid transport system substrate-binding protein
MEIKKRPGFYHIFSITLISIILIITGLSGCARTEPPPKEVAIGALLTLTGDGVSGGESCNAALKLAVEDVNDYLSEVGADLRIKIVIEDTGTDPAFALEKLKTLAEEGIKVIIGPQTSLEVQSVKDYAGQNNILLISPSSTAPSLAIPGDNLFRFCPDDSHQAEALAALMWQDNIRAVVPMWRGDNWGDELASATKTSLDSLGGRVLEGIRYAPLTKDFSSELSTLSARVEETVAAYGAEAVAVHLISLEEASIILNQAASYPALSSVRWYGSDGAALSREIINDERAARYAGSRGFVCPIYGEGKTDNYALIQTRIENEIKRRADVYALASYDAVWVATQVYLATGITEDMMVLKKALQQVSQSYYGTTGWTALNPAGDRKFADYDFWAVRQEGNTLQWQHIARYQVDTDLSSRLITDISFPSKPIRIITGWLGGSEQFLNEIAAEAEKVLGVPVVLVNKVGNDGADATQAFQTSPADGYTLINMIDFHSADFASGKTDINPAADWIPILIGNIAITQIYIRADETRYSNWDELAAYAKGHPELKVATVGSPLYLEGLYTAGLEQAFGIQFEQVSYERSAERYASLVGGQTDLLIEQPGDIKEFLDNGKFKPVLTLWKERVKGFENVPTAKEKGAELAPILRTRGLALLKNTPPDRVEILRAGFQSAFKSDGFQKHLEENLLNLISYPDDTAAFMREQIEIYQQIYASSGQK